MAGFIHIDGDNGLSVNSVAFNAIAELSRNYFSNQDKELVREIYSPIDEGGMDIISLDEERKEAFNAFYRGIKTAFEECKLLGKCGELEPQYFSSVMTSWDELIHLLERDERFIKIYGQNNS